MSTAFIKTTNGGLIPVANVTHAVVGAGRSRIGGPARAVLTIAGGETVVCDRSVLDKGGPLANGVSINPATISKIEGGMAIGKRGETLGRVTNLDALVADATAQPPDPPPPAAAAQPVGVSDDIEPARSSSLAFRVSRGLKRVRWACQIFRAAEGQEHRAARQRHDAEKAQLCPGTRRRATRSSLRGSTRT
jgi:hypothetical protein